MFKNSRILLDTMRILCPVAYGMQEKYKLNEMSPLPLSIIGIQAYYYVF